MGKIYKSSLELVGHTPLLEPQRFNKASKEKSWSNWTCSTLPDLPKTVSPKL